MNRGLSPAGSHCLRCFAPLNSYDESCKTCAVFDRWQLAVETSNVGDLLRTTRKEDVVLIVQYVGRLRERGRRPGPRMPVRKTFQEFDFALQEIEKTARGLELTSIEAVGVLEMVKQSFIEEMFYEDYGEDEGGEEEEGEKS